MIMMTIMTAMIPYSRGVVLLASPVSGVAVGACVAAGELAKKWVPADDP